MNNEIEEITYRLFYNDNKLIPDDFEFFEKYRREHDVYYEQAKLIIRTYKLNKLKKLNEENKKIIK